MIIHSYYQESMQNRHYTFILPVKNEERRISRVIEYYRTYGTILVIDNFSTDYTIQRAKDLGIEVVQIGNNGSIQTEEWMRKVLALSPTSYVALLSCSEYIPPRSLEKFEEVAKTKSHNLISNVLVSYTCGSNIQLWDSLVKRTARRTERFFNRDYLDYKSIFIHRPYKTLAGNDILILPDDECYKIIHVRDSDLKSLTFKCFDYASVETKHIIANGNSFSKYELFKRILADLVRYLNLPRAAKGFIAFRELWARVFMHLSIYFLVWEERENLGIEYSREQSSKLWNSLVSSHKE